MAQTPSTWADYVGDGVEDTFQVTFPYQKQQEVFVTVDGAPAAFTFISAGWVQLAVAPANGAAIRVQRSTEAFEPRHEFENGVPLLPRFIDENNKQFLYVVQETVNETVGVAANARGVAADALNVAAKARGIAQATSDKVDAAVIESAHQLRLDISNAIDPDKGAKLIGYKGSTVAQKLDDLGTAATRNAQVTRTDATAGALMAVGAFGLGANTPDWPNTTLNDFTVPTGFYRAPSSVTDTPFPEYWGVAIEKAPDGAYVRQSIWNLNSATRIFERVISNGVVAAWQELFHTGNLLQTTGTSTGFPMSQAAVTNAINSSSIGVGQTWQNMTASRASDTTYTNTTGKPIQVLVRVVSASSSTISFIVNGNSIGSPGAVGYSSSVSFIVPHGATYSVSYTNVHSIVWAELR
jgi:hypothetical protein